MLTMKTLVRRTDMERHRRERSHPVIAKVTRSSIMIDDNGIFALMYGKAVDLKTHKEKGRKAKGPYLLMAKLYYSDSANNSNPKTFIWCDCADFTFRCEVSLAMRGSSAVINSNGRMPHVTNPQGIPHLCKHCLAFLKKCVAHRKTMSTPLHKQMTLARNDRALIAALKKPRHSRPNVKRMFPDYFSNMQGTRF